MEAIPTLETQRLRLRPLTLNDAAAVQLLASAPEVVDTTLNIPHPYPDGLAKQWIARRADAAVSGASVTWAIADRSSDELYGAISLAMAQQHQHAEMGYWVGVPFWGRGYTTEAAAAVLAHGFTFLGLRRIHAHHLRPQRRNQHLEPGPTGPLGVKLASGRVGPRSRAALAAAECHHCPPLLRGE